MTEPGDVSYEVPTAGGGRPVELLAPAVAESGADPGLLVLLDGEFYRDRMPTASLIADGQRAGWLRSFWTLLVPQLDQPSRWRDNQCSDVFADFLADDVLPWFGREVGAPAFVALGGLSLTGLQVAHTCLRHPARFPIGFCQSPSFWWQGARMADAVRRRGRDDAARIRLWVSCGDQETDEHVDHGPGLYQELSQLEGCHRVVAALRECGHAVEFTEVPGGHDFDTWTADLPACLAFVAGRGR